LAEDQARFRELGLRLKKLGVFTARRDAAEE
jgi:hypothetical protein